MPSSYLETNFEVVVTYENENKAYALKRVLNMLGRPNAEVREVAK